MFRFFKYIKSLFTKEQKKPAPPKIEVPSVPTKPSQPGDIFPDVSHWNHCDFSKFTGKDMILKASDGATRVDPEFFANLGNCIKNGIRVGAYHFYRTGPDPIKQADLFIKTVGLENMKTMYHLPVVDFESVSGSNVGQKQTNEDLRKDMDDLVKFVKHLHDQTGRMCRIYTGRYAFDKMNWSLELLKYCDSPWIADYTGKQPTNSKPWDKIWAWQFTSDYNFDGLESADANKFL